MSQPSDLAPSVQAPSAKAPQASAANGVADPLVRAAEQVRVHLAEATAPDADGPPPRDLVLGVFRRQLGHIQAEVRDAFEAGSISGLGAARQLARLHDVLIQSLFAYALAQQGRGAAADPTASPTPPITLAATGGYGRGVLAPFSDIDL
jgi:[protein-PII] uridylyltransferase